MTDKLLDQYIKYNKSLYWMCTLNGHPLPEKRLMTEFTTPLIVEHLPPREVSWFTRFMWGDLNCRLHKDFLFYTDNRPADLESIDLPDGGHVWIDDNDRVWIKVPKGYEADFATVPRPLWNFISPTGKHGKAAWVHDYLYTHGIHSKAWADAVFKEGLQVLGVGALKRNAMYAGVRIGGRGNY